MVGNEEWPAAVAATSAASREVLKLMVAVKMLEVRWLLVQVERARAIAHANRITVSEVGMIAASKEIYF